MIRVAVHPGPVRAGRLISLVSILAREGRTTAADLASRLEVSERTILRDLEVLSGSGVPVYTTRGVGGGVQLLEGYTPTLPAGALSRPASPRAATSRMTVLVTEEGRRTAAILGYLQPLRVRAEPAGREGWVVATCRLRSLEAMTLEVLALGPQVEVVAPTDLRDRVAELVRRTGALYGSTDGR
jgi:predicted DNA-binding transcriptional regulator YafY